MESRPPKEESLIDVLREAVEDGHLIYSTHVNERMAQRDIVKILNLGIMPLRGKP